MAVPLRSPLLTAAAGLLLACSAPILAAPEVVAIFGASGEGSGELSRPTGIAVAADGRVYVADTGNDRIQVFDASGAFLHGFGERGTGRGQFLRPMDLDLDAEGNVYVAELGGDRVQVFSAEGAWLREIRGDDTDAGSFDGAAGVWVSSTGDIFVADFYNDRIVRFGADGSLGGVLGRPGRALRGRLHYPTDVDGLGDLVVVADAYNHRVQAFGPDGSMRWSLGGLFGLGIPGARPGWFRVASGIATDDEGRLYVADFENHRIQVFDAERRLLAVFGERGSDRGAFERPTDLDIGPDGRLYVVDFGNDRVQVFAPIEDSQ